MKINTHVERVFKHPNYMNEFGQSSP